MRKKSAQFSDDRSYQAAETRGRVAYLASAGLNGSEIAKRLGLSRQHVSHLRMTMGIQSAKSAREQSTESRRRTLAALVASGATNRAALQKRLRVTEHVLYHDIRALGLQDKLRRHDKKTRLVQVSVWTRQGMSVSAQAKLAGVSPETIYNDLVRIGLHERGKRSSDAQARRARVAVWTAGGISVVAQATLAEVSTTTIYQDQRSLGLRRRTRRHISE